MPAQHTVNTLQRGFLRLWFTCALFQQNAVFQSKEGFFMVYDLQQASAVKVDRDLPTEAVDKSVGL